MAPFRGNIHRYRGDQDDDGGIFKFGNMTVDAEAWTVNVAYEEIQ